MKFLSVIHKDLLTLLRDRAEMLVLFLMPLAFIVPISLALGAGDGYGIRRGDQMLLLPVVNYDDGGRATILMTAIGESVGLETTFNREILGQLGLGNDPVCSPPLEPTPTADATLEGAAPPEAAATATAPPAEPLTSAACNERVARAMLERSWRPAVLIIPAGFSNEIDSGKQQQVTLLYDPAGDPNAILQIEGVVKGAAIRVSLERQVGSGQNQLVSLVAFAPEGVRQSVEAAAQTPVENQQPAISLQKVAPSNYQLASAPDTYQQTIPGYAVMFVFFIATSLVGSIHQERADGTFRRLLSTPISRAELLGGKLLSAMFIGLIQVVFLFIIGAVAFGLGLGNDPLAFALLTLALVGCAAAIGLAASTTRLAGGGLTAPLIIAALLGGSMFPLDLMPAALRTLSYAMPHRWAIQGYQNLIVRGLGLQETLPQIAVLLGFMLVFFLIAVWRFRFDE